VPLYGYCVIESGGVASGGVFSIGDGTTATKFSAETSANGLMVEVHTTYAQGKAVPFAADGFYVLTTKTGTAGLVAAKAVTFFVVMLPAAGAN